MEVIDNSIEVEGLTKLYGSVKAIQNLTFQVRRGSIVGFLGPNGAGKSTTMKILCGLSAGTSGKAYIEGINVARDIHRVKEVIGYMPENNPLPEDMRVIEYLRHRARMKGVSTRDQKGRIEEVMDLCDLARKAQKKIIGTLSKGFRQRVGIADSLLGRPKVLLLDEPTIGLDPHQILAIRNLIKNLKGRMTIMISSHILPEIEASCDYSIIINRGHIVAEGTSEALREEFGRENEIELELKCDIEMLHTAIGTIDAEAVINEESLPDGYWRVTITTTQNADFSESIAAVIKNQSTWALRTISRREPTLEDIFIKATRPSWSGTVKTKAKRERDAA